MRPSVGQNAQDQTGATLVEFAIVIPLLLLLLFGLVEFGRLISASTTIRTAAREGARFATTVESTSGTPNYRDCSGIIAAVHGKTVIGSIDAVSITWSSPGYTHTCTDADPSNDPAQNGVVSGTEVTVAVTSSFDSVVPILNTFLDGIPLDTTQTREIFIGEATT